MDNPDKLETQGTQDEDKHNKNTTQYVLDTTTRKQTQIMLIRQTAGDKNEPNINFFNYMAFQSFD